MMGHSIEGIAELLEHVDCPIHVQHDEVEWVTKSTNVTADHLVGHDSGDVLTVGGIEISLVHTPGHTPGSQCFFVDDRLIAGDTLFLEGCGRTDLPGSDPVKMFESLRRLAEVPDSTILFPGHRYSIASSATMDVVKETNFVFQ
jgi:glyoxylase-like metal-dependent hydrolase (beta-lactamase superfamily II)